MKAGKLSESVLSRSVLKQLHKDSGAGVSRMKQLDYGCIKGEENLISACQTIAFACPHPGRLAVAGAANNLACSGVKAEGMSLSVVFPTTGAEQELRSLIQEAQAQSLDLGVPITCGHTEVLSGISHPIVTATAMGRSKEAPIPSSGAKPGMDLVVTKHVGLSGAGILAIEKEEELLKRYSQPFIAKAKEFWDQILIEKEAQIAASHGAAALHDISLGGIYGALWEMADRSNVGLEVDLKQIPIRQETVEICEYLDKNPYKLFGMGSLLIATNQGDLLVEKLAAAKIPSAMIGHTTDGNERILFTGEERRFLETTQPDQLFA